MPSNRRVDLLAIATWPSNAMPSHLKPPSTIFKACLNYFRKRFTDAFLWSLVQPRFRKRRGSRNGARWIKILPTAQHSMKRSSKKTARRMQVAAMANLTGPAMECHTLVRPPESMLSALLVRALCILLAVCSLFVRSLLSVLDNRCVIVCELHIS